MTDASVLGFRLGPGTAGPGDDEERDGPALLHAHLRSWLGSWPAWSAADTVVSSARVRPGWDGQVHPLIGVAGPRGLVVSVPPGSALAVAAVLRGHDPSGDGVARALTRALGRPGRPASRLVFRWCTSPAPLADRGTWLAPTDPVVPGWLRAFDGEVLVAFDPAGLPVSGVGVKEHTRYGVELAVATDPRARGRGLASALVAQAARRVLDEGAVPTCLHPVDDAASARTAEAAGFPDRGWSAFALDDPPA